MSNRLDSTQAPYQCIRNLKDFYFIRESFIIDISFMIYITCYLGKVNKHFLEHGV